MAVHSLTVKQILSRVRQVFPDAPEAYVISLVNDAGLKGWHAGPLCNSVAAEALTSVLISINKKHSIYHSGIKITGI